MRSLLRIGALSGLAAGLAMAAFLATVGRAPIYAALRLEEGQAHESGDTVREELFSRGVQEIGGAIGLIIFGLALGVIFIVVLGAVGKHFAERSAMTASSQLAAIGFTAVVLVPFLKYPANPPAVGNPDTIDQRTTQYFLVLVLSIALVVAVWQARRRMDVDPVPKAWLTAGLYAVGLILIFVLLPASPDPVTISADVVWRFRLASLAGLACGWAVMALVAATLLTRLNTEQQSTSQLQSNRR